MVKLLHLLMKLYWRIRKPVTRGVRVILINHKNEVLLVRHTYTNGWYLPGGMVKRSESDIRALDRELLEEVGKKKYKIDRKLGEFKNYKEYKKDTVVVYIANCLDSLNDIKHFEIRERKFFNINNLPGDISPGTKRRVDEFLNKKKIQELW